MHGGETFPLPGPDEASLITQALQVKQAIDASPATDVHASVAAALHNLDLCTPGDFYTARPLLIPTPLRDLSLQQLARQLGQCAALLAPAAATLPDEYDSEGSEEEEEEEPDPDKVGLERSLLHAAAALGHAAALDALLTVLAPDGGTTTRMEALSSKDAIQRTPLHAAAEYGRSAVIELMLKTVSSANELCLMTDQQGWTAVHYACERGHSEAAWLLIMPAPSAATKADEMQWTPLHHAADGGHAAVVEMLLCAFPAMPPIGSFYTFPDIASRVDANNFTALHAAARNGCAETVQMLVTAAPHIAFEVAAYSGTPLHQAAHYGNMQAALLLLEAAAEAASLVTGFCGTALHAAVKGGHLDLVELLLGVAPDTATIPNMSGQIPLFTAAAEGSPAVTRVLLAAAPGTAGAVQDNGRTPLIVAARGGHVDVMRLLLADLPGPALAAMADQHGHTALHWAAWGGHTAAAALLVETLPALVAAKSATDQTALHRAAISGHVEVLDPLLKAATSSGAAASEADSDGRTALDLALYYQQAATASRLLSHVPPEAALAAAVGALAGDPRFLVEAVTAHLPLTAQQWALVPGCCPGLESVLPAALRHSAQQAQQVVRRLPLPESQRLRTAARCLEQAQQQAGLELPSHIIQTLLALSL